MKRKRSARERGRPWLEGLEPRLLLSANTTLASPFVSAIWFDPVAAMASVDATEQGALTSAATVEKIEWRGETLSVVSDRWIVQFQMDSLAGVSSVAETASLQNADLVSFDVVSGLGMTGQVLIQTYGADFATVFDWLAADADVAYYEPDAVLGLQVIPDDTSFTTLWGLNNTGQSGGTVDVDIDAPEAWDVTTGSSDVVIAVIDTGVDYEHPDLVANMWTNPGETPDDGIDNDGNGLIDDVYGWDWAYGDNDPMDGAGHGTHVSGTIGAVGDNATGVVGVNWTVQIMALKFLDNSGYGDTSDAISAVNYATMMKRDYGVNIVATNNSWGGGGSSSAMSAAIEAAGAEDILFIAAAGNGGADEIGDDNDVTPYYPATYDLDCVISVASITRTNARSIFSNYGATTVDLAAPGSSIYSTLPNKKYGTYSGTSMATPHVSGVVALLAAYDPTASAEAIKWAILDGVDPIAAMDGITVTGGRLNAYGSLQSMDIPGPHVLSVSAAAESAPIDEISILFTEDILPASVLGANVLLRDDGADNIFDTTDDTVYTIGDPDLSQPEGDTVTISLGSMLTDEQYRLTIVGTGGSPIRNLDDEALNEGADEVYFFEVIAASGPYESNDSIAEAPDSGLSGAGSVTLSAYIGDGYYGAKDVDLFAISVDAAATLTATVDAIAIGSSLDSYLRLFDASGTQLAFNDDVSWPDTDSYLQYDLPSSGLYYVGVTGWDNSAYDPNVPNSGVAAYAGEYDLNLLLEDVTPPHVTGVELNGDPDRTVSSIEPSGIGVQTIVVTFDEAVSFAAGDVTVQEVTFPGGTEMPGDVLTPTSITGDGTATITITFDTASVVDTWVKVTLDGGGTITDLAGTALDGEARAGGSGRGYIYDASDLPTGDGTAGGDAVFYVGSLRGDLYGGELFEPDPDGTLGPLDVSGFIAAYRNGNLDADFYGGELFDPIPDGTIGPLDVSGFIAVHRAGASLDALPASLGGAAVMGSASVSIEAPILVETPDEQLASRAESTEPTGALAEDTPVRAGRAGTPVLRRGRGRVATTSARRSMAAERAALEQALADAEADLDVDADEGVVDLLAMSGLTPLPKR